MAKLYHPDGQEEKVTPASENGEWSLEELQRYVGGYIERVPMPTGRPEAYCDEDGTSKGQQANVGATLALGIVLVGPVVVLAEGETLP